MAFLARLPRGFAERLLCGTVQELRHGTAGAADCLFCTAAGVIAAADIGRAKTQLIHHGFQDAPQDLR